VDASGSLRRPIFVRTRIALGTLVIGVLLLGAAPVRSQRRTSSVRSVRAELERVIAPYRYGSVDKKPGTDRSGFTRSVVREGLGLDLPRSSRHQARMGRPITRAQLRPGDLVFFATGHKNRINHVVTCSQRAWSACIPRWATGSTITRPKTRRSASTASLSMPGFRLADVDVAAGGAQGFGVEALARAQRGVDAGSTGHAGSFIGAPPPRAPRARSSGCRM
jgi:hypothetical protein